MKILIVDDEVIIRTGLSRVINWEELGLELLEPAASAEEAIARLSLERPHIILTDIRMTGKTGLQLAEESRRVLPETEVIILTGFDDFSYTQQAIRQNVSDYLLKTSGPEEIIKTVLQAKQRIEQKWSASSHEHQKAREARDRLFERVVIEGTADWAETRLLADWLPNLFHAAAGEPVYQVVLISAAGWDEKPDFPALLLFAIANMLNELLPCETLIRKKEIVALLSARQEQGKPVLPPQVPVKIERLLKCRLTVALGRPVERPENVAESFTTAVYARQYRNLLDTQILDYVILAKRTGGRSGCTNEEELELSALLLQNDQVALKRWVHRLVEDRLQDPQMTIDSLQTSLLSLAFAARRWLRRVLAATGREEVTLDEAAQFRLNADSLPIEEMFRFLYGVMKLYHFHLSEGRSAHVQKVLAYISEHLEREIGLQQAARHVHLNPGHLSELFKRETGSTFGDYVTRQKIARAKELLSVSPAKISEIAARLGYEDVKYFGQLFKKLTGKTPSEFRSEAATAESRK